MKVVSGWDLRREAQGQTFNYTELCPITVGTVIRAVTGTTMAQFAEKNLWQPLGAEADAAWCTDSQNQEYNCVRAKPYSDHTVHHAAASSALALLWCTLTHYTPACAPGCGSAARSLARYKHTGELLLPIAGLGSAGAARSAAWHDERPTRRVRGLDS